MADQHLPATGTALLLPGPQPPMTHLGVTLLRHAVVTGLRYAFHQLGLPLPEPAPVCIDGLRLGLCPRHRIEGIADDPRLAAVVGALEDPAGSAASPIALRGALAFHRLRLRLLPRKPGTRDDGSPLGVLRRYLPGLQDALLAEVVASLLRRGRRARGAEVGATQSREAARWLARRTTRLSRLGPPDPYRPSWDAGPPSFSPAEVVGGAATRDPLRGRFRESWRAAASALHPVLRELGERACRRGVAEHPEDPFFLPLQVLDDLAGERRPEWLTGAILTNRAEYFGLLRAADDETRNAWERAPLALLP
ncbi:MAG: hypothetical protein R2991_01470 [Thermoanaerobaculia bacterium]